MQQCKDVVGIDLGQQRGRATVSATVVEEGNTAREACLDNGALLHGNNANLNRNT